MKRSAAPALARSPGLLHWVLPLMLVPLTLTVLLSGRDLSHVMIEMTRGGGMYLHPAIAWIQRCISLILLLITVGGFAIATAATAYTIRIYRLGWYAGRGARLVACVPSGCPGSG